MKSLSRLKEAVAESLATRAATRAGLRIRFFEDWQPELDAALTCLPEEEICPHELFVALCVNPGPVQKRVVLVEERGEPVAVVGLRRADRGWVPVTHYIVPGFLFPVKEGRVGKVLEAIGLDVQVAWWRWREPPEKLKSVREISAFPTFGIECSEDFEEFWGRSSTLRNVQKFRKRCRDFELRINVKGLTELITRQWELRWRPQGIHEMPDLRDRILAASYLEAHGLLHSLTLFDRDRAIAGGTMITHRNEAVAQVNFRDMEYDKFGVMNRVIDYVFSWAKETGFRAIDIGGVGVYKGSWAPEHGTKWEFRICPDRIMALDRFTERAHSAWSKIKSFTR